MQVWSTSLGAGFLPGLGRFSERQIFNALRYGLRPGDTPDIEITSAIAGEGNHPRHPKYLPPSMPWKAWPHLSDEEIRAIAAYLEHGLKPVRNLVPASGGPSDFWAGFYRAVDFGTLPAAAFPTTNERVLPDAAAPVRGSELAAPNDDRAPGGTLRGRHARAAARDACPMARTRSAR